MDNREKIELSNHDDYILRIDNEAFVITGLNEKLNKFLSVRQKEFYYHVQSHLHFKVEDKYEELSEFHEEWCDEGVECTVLKSGGEWQTGKVRFQLKAEFFPDKPEIENAEENGHQEVENITESPLDEIRQQLTDESQS